MQSDTWLKKIVVGHGADAGVGPDIDGGLNHVDYGIYGKYDAHDGPIGTHYRLLHRCKNTNNILKIGRKAKILYRPN